MRRAFALAVLFSFIVAPVSRVVCGLDCLPVGEVAATDRCHEQDSAAPAFSIGVDHCEGSGLPVALTAKLGDVRTAAPLGLAPAQPAPIAELNARTLSPSGDTAPSPPPNRLIPLRI